MHILSTGVIGDRITTNVVYAEKVPVIHNTANTQIRKHHILISNWWKSEYFRK